MSEYRLHNIITYTVLILYFCMYYRKQQILCSTKLSRFTGFYQNVGKTFTILLTYNAYLNHC